MKYHAYARHNFHKIPTYGRLSQGQIQDLNLAEYVNKLRLTLKTENKQYA